MKRFLGLCLAAAVLSGVLTCCRTVPVVPPAPPPVTVPSHPALERTYGNVVIGSAGDLAITYKELHLAVDPPASALAGLASTLDFLLLTGSSGPMVWPSGVRRDLKILAPARLVAAARQAGFVNAKALEAGQRLLLSKTAGFLFVSAVPSTNKAAGGAVNGYLLEFDNGRNVFISGDVVDEAPLRQFVYDLRDDGKQLHLALVNAGTTADGVQRRFDESKAAEIISLLQPTVAVLIPRGALNADQLKQAFSDQIFDGSWTVGGPQQSIPF